jgi:Flp pilus assembly pilin Flp
MSSKHSQPSHGEGGQGLAEYSLILVLIAISLVTVLMFFGEGVKNVYCSLTHQLPFGVDQTETTSCNKPFVNPTLLDRGPGYINLEAIVLDPDGDPDNPYGAISKVEFYMDSDIGSPVQIEYQYKYCLGAGDDPCNNYSIESLSLGDHTVIIKAYDVDGHVGVSHFRFTK